jgi:hypothetical protein
MNADPSTVCAHPRTQNAIGGVSAPVLSILEDDDADPIIVCAHPRNQNSIDGASAQVLSMIEDNQCISEHSFVLIKDPDRQFQLKSISD